jgi:hypothetical protein
MTMIMTLTASSPSFIVDDRSRFAAVARARRIAAAVGVSLIEGTSAFVESLTWMLDCVAATNIGLADALFQKEQISAQRALQEIKSTSGLTWQQLARVFDVVPRSLHLWMDGEALDSIHEERLYRLLKIVRGLPYSTPFQNRTFLLAPRADGTIPFDLLVEGKDEALKTLPKENPVCKITAEERALNDERKPLPPWILMDALQDRVHLDLPGGRSVKTVKRGKPSE